MNHLDPAKQNTGADKVVWQALEDATARRLKPAMLFVHLWKNSFKADKSATLEIREILSIGGTSFRENDNWIINSCFFAGSDSLRNLFLN